jgi:hypothetical protein
LLKSPMEENQHHSDLKYFDFLHYTSETSNNDNNDTAAGNKSNLFSTTAPEKVMTSKHHTSNGDGVGHAYNDRYDDKDLDELDGGNEMPVYGRKAQRMGYDEPEYAMVDLKKKSDDRMKSNGMVTGGSNIMGEYF